MDVVNHSMAYLPGPAEESERAGLRFITLAIISSGLPRKLYYYAVESTVFGVPLPHRGTYSKYNSIDDQIDDCTITRRGSSSA